MNFQIMVINYASMKNFIVVIINLCSSKSGKDKGVNQYENIK